MIAVRPGKHEEVCCIFDGRSLWELSITIDFVDLLIVERRDKG